MELGASANSGDSAAGSAETAAADRAARMVVAFMVETKKFLRDREITF